MTVQNHNIEEIAKSCYIDTERFIVEIKTEGFYEDIAEDAKSRFDIPKYEVEDQKHIAI